MAKVIILGSAHPLRGGGLATFNERLAYELLSQGHQVIIFTFSLQYPRIFFPGKTQYTSGPAPKGLDIRIKVNSLNPLNWFRVASQIRDEAPDLLIIRYWLPYLAPCLGTIAGLAGKNTNTKVLAITDNIIPHERRPGDKILTKYFIKNIDGFITLSRSVLVELEKIEKTGKPKIFSPHPLYDNFGQGMTRAIALETLKLSDQYRYILFFGFIRPYKGLDILLNAMIEPTVRQLPIKLIVAGELYSSGNQYMKTICDNGLGLKIILHTDFIPNELVAAYFCASDLVVQPYREASQSGVTQIAYHFGVPMIVTNVGALPEMVPHKVSGLVVAPDPKMVARAICQFFTNTTLSEKLKEGVIGQKRRFSWQNLVNDIFKVADQVKA